MYLIYCTGPVTFNKKINKSIYQSDRAPLVYDVICPRRKCYVASTVLMLNDLVL